MPVESRDKVQLTPDVIVREVIIAIILLAYGFGITRYRTVGAWIAMSVGCYVAMRITPRIISSLRRS